MKLDAVKMLISRYIRSNNNAGDEFNLSQEEDNDLYTSTFRTKIVKGVISQCDADLNGELDTNEIFKLSQKLTSFEEFLGVSFDGFLDAVDSDVDWEEMNQEKLSQDELLNQNYQQKTDFANFVLSTDSNISKEQFKKSVDLDIKLDENLIQINELTTNKDNLTDEQKATLNELLAQRQELLTSRGELEAELMEVGDKKTVEAIKEMQKARGELNSAQLETTENISTLQQQYGIVPQEQMMQESYSGGGGGGNGSSSSKQNSTNKDTGDVKNKSKEELEKDLTTQAQNLATQQANLQGIIEGTNPDLNAAKETMDTSYEEYQKLLNEVSPELAQKLNDNKIALDDAQKNFDTNQINITNCSSWLATLQANMTHLDSNIASYKSAISSLDATDTTNFTPEQKTELETRKKELNDALAKVEQEKTTLQAEIDKSSAQLETFNNNVEPLTQALTTAQTNYDTTQAEIDALENETITQAKNAFTEQEKAYNDKKIALVTQFNQGVVDATKKIQEIETQISVLDKQEIEAQGKMGANGNTVTLNGQNYDSVVPQEEVEELLKLINDTKANNKGDHYDMCLAFAIWYGQYLEGKASASEFKQFLKPGNIPYGNGSISTDDYASDDKNEILSRIADDINAGHPAIVQVGASNNTSRHYVLVVGLRAGAKNPPTEDDLLIIDTYDGKLEGMGQYGSRDMITGKQCGKKYSGYQMYHFNV